MLSFFFFKQKTAYDMRISDWSSDVCSSDLFRGTGTRIHRQSIRRLDGFFGHCWLSALFPDGRAFGCLAYPPRSGESEYSYNEDRKSVVEGKSVSVRVDLGGRRFMKKKKRNKTTKTGKVNKQTKNKN